MALRRLAPLLPTSGDTASLPRLSLVHLVYTFPGHGLRPASCCPSHARPAAPATQMIRSGMYNPSDHSFGSKVPPITNKHQGGGYPVDANGTGAHAGAPYAPGAGPSSSAPTNGAHGGARAR